MWCWIIVTRIQRWYMHTTVLQRYQQTFPSCVICVDCEGNRKLQEDAKEKELNVLLSGELEAMTPALASLRFKQGLVALIVWTGEVAGIKKPEGLLGRFPFPELVVDASITCLRNGDVYNYTHFYPDPQHRTTALSLQGGHLYVLFYSPENSAQRFGHAGDC